MIDPNLFHLRVVRGRKSGGGALHNRPLSNHLWSELSTPTDPKLFFRQPCIRIPKPTTCFFLLADDLILSATHIPPITIEWYQNAPSWQGNSAHIINYSYGGAAGDASSWVFCSRTRKKGIFCDYYYSYINTHHARFGGFLESAFLCCCLTSLRICHRSIVLL